MEEGGIRFRQHPLCRFLAGRQELLIGGKELGFSNSEGSDGVWERL